MNFQNKFKDYKIEWQPHFANGYVNVDTCNTCKYQIKICKHPWNEREFSKGGISEIISYGCSVQFDSTTDKNPRIIMMDHDTSVSSCELYHLRKD
jgi:hypothetical protein